MANVTLNTQTRTQLDSIITDPAQSILLFGPVGVGMSGAIDYLAAGLDARPIRVLPERNEKVDVEKGTITVAAIRRLYDMTKTISSQRRLIIIDQAERMGLEAQHAFLKLLEEPTANTHFIIAAHNSSKLLPTVLSRVQPVEVRPITLTQSQKLLEDLGVRDQQKLSQLLFIAEGLPAELSRLALGEEYFLERSGVVRDARQYIQGSTYDRLRIAQQYKDDRTKALLLLQDAMNQLRRSMLEGRKGNQLPLLDQLLRIHQQIEGNGNIRLQLANVL